MPSLPSTVWSGALFLPVCTVGEGVAAVLSRALADLSWLQNGLLRRFFESVLEDGEARLQRDLPHIDPRSNMQSEFKRLVAEVHGSRTHPRTGSCPSNRFEDGEAHRDPSTPLVRMRLSL
jgi:hypothetical protein